jgi:hypothetical protein
LAFATEHEGDVEACVAKPGFVTGHGDVMKYLRATALKWTVGLPNVAVEEISAAMLDQVLRGFEAEPIFNDDLRRIGEKVLRDTPIAKG